MMTIPKNKYNELKPYYDFQRKKEFNKDWCSAIIKRVFTLSGGVIGADEKGLAEEIYANLKEEDYQTPPINYVPDNPDWRIEGENYDNWKEIRKNIQIGGQFIWREQ
tara:strand:- start:301 stop:621 length:321 start_codon:yes stop_codon:yes gene_type:complete